MTLTVATEFAPPWDAPDDVRITGVRAITTAPEGIPLVVVKVTTSDHGLYGLGCATFSTRWKAVVPFVDEYVSRLVAGRYPGDIEDLTQLVRLSAYWREGPVGNNALSGLDHALWDIAGKRPGARTRRLAPRPTTPKVFRTDGSTPRPTSKEFRR